MVKCSHVPIKRRQFVLCAWRFPYSLVLLRRGGSGTLSGGPHSQPPENPHSNTQMSSPYLPYANPHSYTNLPLTTFNHNKKPELLKTYNNRNRQPASQPDKRDQAVTAPNPPPPKVHGKNDYYRWKFGDNMICHYYIHLLLVFFFFSFLWGEGEGGGGAGSFYALFHQKYIYNFFLYLQFICSIFIYFKTSCFKLMRKLHNKIT
jgi:hypothetical protein